KINNENQASLVEAAEANVKVQTAQMRSAVNVAVKNAMEDARTNPEGAMQNVKTMLQAVRNNRVLSEADRAIMSAELERTGQYIEQESEK
ncbi:MAG: hypothetical protein J6X44_11685, partial [Thermoguttaceae bacterium]|nr:hypothetical protein [Thermoguttaceae bacterium]